MQTQHKDTEHRHSVSTAIRERDGAAKLTIVARQRQMQQLKTQESASRFFESRKSIHDFRQTCAVIKTTCLLELLDTTSRQLSSWCHAKLRKQHGYKTIEKWLKKQSIEQPGTFIYNRWVFDKDVDALRLQGDLIAPRASLIAKVGYVSLQIETTPLTGSGELVHHCGYTTEERLGYILARMKCIREELVERQLL